MEEIWKDIENFEGLYQVSNLGRVKSLPKPFIHPLNKKTYFRPEKILKCDKTKDGYLRARMFKDGVTKRIFVSILVARAFIPNPENKPCVDHIDTIRSNNIVSNLRWVTMKENMNNPVSLAKRREFMKGRFNPRDFGNYIFPIGSKHHNARRIVRINPSTNEIFHYGCMKEPIKDGFGSHNISECCRHKKKRYKGQIFMYEEEYNERISKGFPLIQ